MPEVRLSSKGQIVIPKEIRQKLGLKPGDKVRFEVTKDKTAVMRSALEPPKDVFVKAGSKRVDAILKEADRIDEAKIRRLLEALGVKK